MVANATLTSTETIDVSAFNIRPYFSQTAKDGSVSFRGGVRWTVDSVRLQVGPNPSVALVRIPLAAVNDEVAPVISGVITSPLTGIKIGTPCQIVGFFPGGYQKLMSGRVVSISQDIKKDQAILEVWDERWILQACQISGSFWMSGDASSNTVSYRQGIPPHFNPGGKANAIKLSATGYDDYVYAFCPPNYNLANAEEPPEDSDGDQGTGNAKAMYWTPGMMLKYLRFAFSQTAYNSYIKLDFPWYLPIPDSIVWPATLDSAFGVEGLPIKEKAQELTLDGFNLMGALERICKMAGNFSINLEGKVKKNQDKTTEVQNTIQVVRMKYKGGGITINRPTSGNAKDVIKKAKAIVSGFLSETGINTYTRAAIAGELVYIQRRFDTSAPTGLEIAWSAADQAAWFTYYKGRRAGTDGFPADTESVAFDKANRKFPHVWAAYRMIPSYDFQEGTTEEGFPQCNTMRAPLPHILTSYLENITGSPTTQEQKMRHRIPVLVENKPATAWFPCQWNDGFSIDPDTGVMFFHGLRDRRQTVAVTLTAATAIPLRMTLAIPADHRLVAASKLSTDPLDSEAVETIPADAERDDSDRIYEGLERLYYADAQGLYLYETVKGGTTSTPSGSFSVPESAQGSTPDANGNLRNDFDLLANHAFNRMQEVGAIQRGGTLVTPFLRVAWRPGQAIGEMQNNSVGGNYPIRSIVSSVTLDVIKNETVSELV